MRRLAINGPVEFDVHGDVCRGELSANLDLVQHSLSLTHHAVNVALAQTSANLVQGVFHKFNRI